MLDIINLQVVTGTTPILLDVSLSVKPGEVHVIMGPNGSGKSTLAQVLAGHPDYQVITGTVIFEGEEITNMKPTERALRGIFLGFQYPVEIPGVNNSQMLKAALNAKRKYNNEPEVDAFEFLKILKSNIQLLGINPSFLNRNVNEGFSGGEKKRNEILQMLTLEPKLCLLDEIDSGLDIDALKIVADGVNKMRSPERSFIIITHYQRLLDYIEPDVVHVLINGQIAETGTKDLAKRLEEQGYATD